MKKLFCVALGLALCLVGTSALAQDVDLSAMSYDELSAFMGDVLAGKPNFRYRLISVLSRMSPDEWKLLEKKIMEIAGENENAAP